MTRQLARLADLAYRRRGRMVLAWLAAAVVIIGVGSLAGEYNADYDTPGSESKAASDLTEERFAGYSGQEIYVVWKDPAGADNAAAKQRIDAFIADARKVDHIAPATPIRISEDGKIGATTLPLTVAGWDVPKEDGEKLIAAAEANSGGGLEIKLGGDPIYAAQEPASPEGIGFLGAAIVLLIAFGSVVAAGLPLIIALVGLGITSGGLIVLLANVVDVPDWTTAVSGLIGIGVGIDYSLLVLTRFRAAMNEGKDRHDASRRGGHDRRAQRDHRRRDGGDLRARPVPDRAALHVRRRDLGLAGGPGGDARRGQPAAGAARLPLARGSTGCGSRSSAARCKAAEPDGESPAARWSHAVQRRPWTAAIVARGPARAGGARARDAARLPGRGQRPALDDDPPGLRPPNRGLRPGHQRSARDRRRAAARARAAEIDALAQRLRGERGVDFVADPVINKAGRRGDRHRDPDDLAAGLEDRDLVHRLRDDVVPDELSGAGITRRDRRRDAGARGPERVHEGPPAAVHDRRRRALLPAAARGVPLAADLAQGGDHEPALGQRRLRRDDARGQGRTASAS